jgi:hypothetical protein
MRSNLQAAAALIAIAAVLAPTMRASADPVAVPIDGEASVNGVGVGCTGVGESKLDPKWLAYPVRVEFSDASNAYLANEVLTVSGAGGAEVLSVFCEGPWILLKLAPGNYRIEGRVQGTDAKVETATVRPPSHGQTRIVLRFPDL